MIRASIFALALITFTGCDKKKEEGAASGAKGTESAQKAPAGPTKLPKLGLSIEAPGSEGHPVHIKLLQKEIVILEGLDLRGVGPGEYELVCLPLKYIGGTGDGSPARTVLRKM